MAKIAFVHLSLSMVEICHWPLYKFDIKNDFLHGDLEEEVYMEQPLGFIAQREFNSLVCQLCSHSMVWNKLFKPDLGNSAQ